MKRAIPIHGTVDELFSDVKESFSKNFKEGWEKAGAAFCVIHRGHVVVDLWGGYADVECNKEWKEDTISTVFSCTKSATAICFAMLVDRGLCDYSDKVTKYWPEFGANGKEDITIDMVLSHTAGIPYFNKRITFDELLDNEKIAKIIETQAPIFPPGSKTAYQPLTFGWMADQIFRKIEPQNRTVGQFFRDELAIKHHIDMHIGDCTAEENRLARLFKMSRLLAVREFGYDKMLANMARYYYNPRGYFQRAMDNMRDFGSDFTIYNNSDLRITGQPGVNGVASARALAQLHQLILDGSILSSEAVKKISTPVNGPSFDHTLGEPQVKERGFTYDKSPKGSWQFGHPGVGGQIVRADPENELVIAYLTNAMKAGVGDHVFTYMRLQKKVYDTLARIPKFEVPLE
ncbi:unnamed protein product [Caenorhabditis auriculariae]|uniref:Beta-lactamase-related domain-containing protein n=1 Tax=Caenorhabditis auriculariae TaxID=2777116 RepID=A0A8S1H746_9PELO|nr:unnamed protein product [Caenorhabditis auriculariae]